MADDDRCNQMVMLLRVEDSLVVGGFGGGGGCGGGWVMWGCWWRMRVCEGQMGGEKIKVSDVCQLTRYRFSWPYGTRTPCAR